MDRKEGAAGRLSLGSVVARPLPIALAAGLMLWLACLSGCNSQGNAARQSYHQVRPISNTARLLQNASYYRQVGRLELAVDELELARLKEPNNLEILDALIRGYEDLGDFDRAQELYEEALAKRGGHHPALENNRCYSLYLQGRLDQAEICFRKALANQPDNQKIRNNLGLVLCRQGREAEALAMWREALSDTEARQRMGQAMTALGKEVPPSLAGPAPTPMVAQINVPSNPAAPSATATITPKAAPPPFSPSPAPQILAQMQNSDAAAPADRRTTGAAEPPASQAPPPATVATPGSPARSASLPEQPRAGKATAAAEPTLPTTTAAQNPAASRPRETPSPAPLAAAPVKQPKKDATPALTALELEGTWIEVKNGNGVHNQARDTRNQLFLDGFTVVGIGNHIDFGLEETVITYRPGAARVAQALSQKFFPGAKLEEGGNLSREADIRVSLGRDRLTDTNIARQGREVPAALASAPSPAARGVTPPPSRKTMKDEALPQAAGSPATPPEFLTAEELNQVRIELRNGNGIPGQAWEMGGHLALEGFTVVNVGNSKDFGLEKTVITYRPEAARVAQVLSKKFFPKATLEAEGQLPPWTDVRVSLGRDLVVPSQAQMAQAPSGTAMP